MTFYHYIVNVFLTFFEQNQTLKNYKNIHKAIKLLFYKYLQKRLPDKIFTFLFLESDTDWRIITV